MSHLNESTSSINILASEFDTLSTQAMTVPNCLFIYYNIFCRIKYQKTPGKQYWNKISCFNILVHLIHVVNCNMDEAIVAVFGDLGRSPRMINHARELLKMNYFIHLIGYSGGKIIC